jgi:hypothetical protein
MPYKDPEMARASSRRAAQRRRATPEGREALNAGSRRWRERNPDASRAGAQAWREANPDKVKLQTRRRKGDPVQHEKQLARAAADSRTHYAQPEGRLKQRAARVLSAYGITLDQVAQLLLLQGGTCAICGGTEPGKHRGKVTNWHVDHNHKTGEVRGLLCINCNNGLGRFKDTAELLGRAYDYLLDPPARKVLKAAA